MPTSRHFCLEMDFVPVHTTENKIYYPVMLFIFHWARVTIFWGGGQSHHAHAHFAIYGWEMGIDGQGHSRQTTPHVGAPYVAPHYPPTTPRSDKGPPRGGNPRTTPHTG